MSRLPRKRARWLARRRRAKPDERTELACTWCLIGRPDQWAPGGDWTAWILTGGRGSGKTRAGADLFRELTTGQLSISPIALVGETMTEARAVMVEGLSPWWDLPNAEIAGLARAEAGAIYTTPLLGSIAGRFHAGWARSGAV